MKKTTDAAKTLAAEATRKRSVVALHSGRKEVLPSTTSSTSSKEMEKLGRLATDIKVDNVRGLPFWSLVFHKKINSCELLTLNFILCKLHFQTTDTEGRDHALGFKRIQAHKSGPFDFENIQFAQELESPHLGPIWCMKFSHCGQLLATAGQDKNIMVWVVKDSYDHFKGGRSIRLAKSNTGWAWWSGTWVGLTLI